MPNGALKGKAALVTGGSRGIGAGIARRLAADGARVLLTYAHSPDLADRVVRDIRQAGGVAKAFRADSTRTEDVAESVQAAVETYGGLDILVNNAGGGTLRTLDEIDTDEIDWVLAVNVRAVVTATRQALRHLPDGGRIIHIGSVNADRMPIPGGSVYSLSKGAVAGFTRGLARELGPRNITVNNVQPGPVDTDLNSATGPAAPLMLAAMALDRFGTAAEVASLVAYLAGPEAAFITGTSITIDGGFGA